MNTPALMVGIGEVLWDLLPSGRVLGGAPANFAYMASVLGDQGIVASRIGSDDLGQETYRVIEQLGLSTKYLQHDDCHETGTATVSIDTSGQPNFTIKEPASWDFLEWTPDWEELCARADVICFGSLAQRSAMSAVTIQSFLQNASARALRICDINLRQPFYTPEVLRRSFRYSDIVKLNDHELLEVSRVLNLGAGTEEALAQRLLQEYELRLVCVTRAARGSLLVSDTRTFEHKGLRVKVADAVGAGDAFTACLAHHVIRGSSLEEISESANRFASWVATQTGATPAISTDQLQNIFTGVAYSLKFS